MPKIYDNIPTRKSKVGKTKKEHKKRDADKPHPVVRVILFARKHQLLLSSVMPSILSANEGAEMYSDS